VQDAKSALAKLVRKENILSKRLRRKFHYVEHFGSNAAIAPDQELSLQQPSSLTWKMSEKFKKVNGTPAQIRWILNSNRASGRRDSRILSMPFELVDPICRNNTILVRKQNQTSLGRLTAPVARGAGTQTFVGSDEYDLWKPAHNISRGSRR
jgi:hypothetical protein